MTPLSDQISKNDEITELKLGLSRSKMEGRKRTLTYLTLTPLELVRPSKRKRVAVLLFRSASLLLFKQSQTSGIATCALSPLEVKCFYVRTKLSW